MSQEAAGPDRALRGAVKFVALANHRKGSLTKATFLSARNDALANVAIILAGFVTAVTLSAWPDLVVGLAIAAMNTTAARTVELARSSCPPRFRR